MKIKPEHYAHMRDAIRAALPRMPFARAQYLVGRYRTIISTMQDLETNHIDSVRHTVDFTAPKKAEGN